uniref:Uncharacterized protein n=1 Tax=Aegilops tauschii TaxID=37682 RepID=M8C531_AEGTA
MANKKDKRFSDSTAMVRKRSPPRPTTLHEVPDKLLELILLHLSSPLWLIHAAATCKRWRRIIVDRRFLCNISNSDPSSVVAGDYHNHASPVDGRRHVFVPSSPALAVGSRHFSLDFLPAGGGTSWEIIDSCYSLLLLAKKKTGWRRHCLPDLLVCEPVTQRYRLIPRMEHMKYERCLTVFLHGCHSRGATTRRGHTIDVMLKFKGSSLHVFAYNDGDWDLEESLELMEATCGLEGYKDEYFRVPMKIVTASTMSIVLSPADQTWQFSVDLETMEVTRYKNKTHGSPSVAYPCELPWLPAIHACMWRLGARCAVMDSRRWRQLSGVMVTSMAEWPDKVEASISALKTDPWKMAATTHVSASDQFMPQTRISVPKAPAEVDIT